MNIRLFATCYSILAAIGVAPLARADLIPTTGLYTLTVDPALDVCGPPLGDVSEPVSMVGWSVCSGTSLPSFYSFTLESIQVGDIETSGSETTETILDATTVWDPIHPGGLGDYSADMQSGFSGSITITVGTTIEEVQFDLEYQSMAGGQWNFDLTTDFPLGSDGVGTGTDSVLQIYNDQDYVATYHIPTVTVGSADMQGPAAPEPSTCAFAGMGCAMVALGIRRRRRVQNTGDPAC
jgi:hypothetical protein